MEKTIEIEFDIYVCQVKCKFDHGSDVCPSYSEAEIISAEEITEDGKMAKIDPYKIDSKTRAMIEDLAWENSEL